MAEKGDSSPIGAGRSDIVVRERNDHGGDPNLDRATQERLGLLLRAYYSGLVEEPVPKRLLDLIDDLRRREIRH